jgi:ubiquinone/menaquinone biosynthesis C-methylase UbiE
MNQLLIALGFLLPLIAVVALWQSRRHPRPCPWWLRWLLHNPHMESVAGAAILIKRMELKPGMSLLDVGCGPGRLTIPFAQHLCPQGHVTAFDVHGKMLQSLRANAARHRVENVEVVCGRAGEGDMKWEDRFDRAVLVTVLGEIPNKPRALQEIYRALKPGGVLSVTEVLPDPDFLRARTVIQLASAAGFQVRGRFGSLLSFTTFLRNH